MNKRGFCIFLMTILLSVGIFWKPVNEVLFQKCLNTYCTHLIGAQLKVEKIYKKDGNWVLEKPFLSPPGAVLSADRCLFSIGFSPLKRSIDLKILVENSRIELIEEGTNLEVVIREIISKSIPYWLFNLQTTLQISEGKIFWHEKSEDRVEAFQADYMLDAHSKNGIKKRGLLPLSQWEGGPF